LNLAHEANQKR